MAVRGQQATDGRLAHFIQPCHLRRGVSPRKHVLCYICLLCGGQLWPAAADAALSARRNDAGGSPLADHGAFELGK
jgi:hypothetical protein